MLGYSIMVMSLGMYVMAECISAPLQPYFCNALQVSFARGASADRAPIRIELLGCEVYTSYLLEIIPHP